MRDLIFTLGGLFFFMGLIPSIRSVDKPALWTSITTSFWLYVFSATYLTFPDPLWFTSVVTFVTASAWAVLAWQKWREPTLVLDSISYEPPQIYNHIFVRGDEGTMN